MGIAFLVTSLVVCLTPGAGVLYTLAAGLSGGARAGLVAAFSCTLGTLPHFVAALTGVAALLQANPTAFRLLTWAGAGYLLFLAWQLWHDRSALVVDADAVGARAGLGRVVRECLTLNLLNPKLTAFFFAFLPQFVPAEAPDALAQLVRLGSVFVLMTFVVFVGYGLAAAGVRDQIASRPRVVAAARRVFALTFVGLGVRLATS